MVIEPKIKNPIRVRIGKNENKILADTFCSQEYPLTPGVMIANEHYGFSLIIDTRNGQKEVMYPTQCNIQAIGLEKGLLKIFENNKKNCWVFDDKGNLKHSNNDEFSEDIRSISDLIIQNTEFFTSEYKVENPIKIKLEQDKLTGRIIFDGEDAQEYPLTPGVMIGTLNYGFIIIIEKNNTQKEIVYPTQGRIEGIECEGGFSDIKIYEEGKYHPWLFDDKGAIKEKATYNLYSRKDHSYINDTYPVSNEVDRQNLLVKKDNKRK